MRLTKNWKFLAFAILFLFANVCYLPANAEDNVYKTFTPETSFTIDAATGLITGYTGTDTTVIVPMTIQGIPVTGLSTTFKDNKTVTEIILPDSITTIGEATFSNCEKLSTIATYSTTPIPAEQVAAEETREITEPWNAIQKHTRIQVWNADNTCTYYHIKKLSGTVLMPTGLTSLGNLAFQGTTSIREFAVIDGNACVKTNGQAGDKLKDAQGTLIPYTSGPILLSADGTIMHRWASAYHHAGTYNLPTGIVTIAPCAAEKANDVQGFSIPNTVTSIGDYGFCQGGNLNQIVFEDSSQVASIGAWAFAHNSNVAITLPTSVTSLGEYCFAHCVNSVPNIENCSITAIPDYCFYECTNYHFSKFPATLTTIGKYAFYSCDNINNVKFPDTISSIGEGAFKDCQNLHEVDIPEGLTTLEADTFSGCQNLQVILLPDSLKEIESGAFEDCQNIHVMVIPPNVDYIAPDSFEGANTEEIDATKNDYVQEIIPSEPLKKGTTITLGKIKYKITKATKSKKKYGTVKVMGATTKKLTKLTIPSTLKYRTYKFKVTAVSAKAFKSYKKLKTVSIGNNVTTIGKEAFKSCTKLSKVTLGKKVKTISSSAFYGDKKLKTLIIKSKVLKSVGKKAFSKTPKTMTVKTYKNKIKSYKKLLKKGNVGTKVKYKKL